VKELTQGFRSGEMKRTTYVRRKEPYRNRNAPLGTKAFEDCLPIAPKTCLRCSRVFKPTEENINSNHCLECVGVPIVRIL